MTTDSYLHLTLKHCIIINLLNMFYEPKVDCVMVWYSMVSSRQKHLCTLPFLKIKVRKVLLVIKEGEIE